MIFISIENFQLAKEVERSLTDMGVESRYVRPSKRSYLELYQDKVTGIVVECRHESLPNDAWSDLLNSLAKRMPVLVNSASAATHEHFHVESIFKLMNPSCEDVILTLDHSGALGRAGSISLRNKVSLYDQRIALHMMQKNKSLSVLAINAQDFQQIATEYGNEAYLQLTSFFEKMLFTLWGAPGSFRTGDVLCKKSNSSNVYYIFLELSRSMQDIPLPGTLEKLADRLVLNLQHLLWNELFKMRSKRELPECINTMPSFSVGYATKINNPCVKPNESLVTLLEDASLSAKVQQERISARESELLQSLIRYDGMLVPAFQAVIQTDLITDEDIEKAEKESSIAHIKHAIYGFESLIRVNEQYVNKLIDQDGPVYLEARFLKPNVLFGLAAKTRLSLELDQVCIAVGGKYGAALPGKLLVNILPRNLYYIDQLQHLVPKNVQIIFELSESEAINNFELLLKVRDSLNDMNLGIAADDFGKGYAGLERVIKVKPDLIKLDRILIENIHNEPGKASFVKGLVEAARTSKSKILAEGVETIEEFRTCKELGVDLMQGFLFHRPVAIETILEDLASIQPEENLQDDHSVDNTEKIEGAA